MTDTFDRQIANALGADMMSNFKLVFDDKAELPSCYPVSALATASVAAAAQELANLFRADEVTVNRRHASFWFDRTLQPQGWSLPSVWDSIAGVYQASDGWIRLHTNAPHHRKAALSILGCDGEKPAVQEAVSDWQKSDLETAIVDAGGAAAAMHSADEWRVHPQGYAVHQEPLIAWTQRGANAAPIDATKIKVLDLTRVLAGPVATRFLAGFGAEVLRIDPPWWDEPGVVPEVSLGKRRAGLDLSQKADRRTFEQLLAQADVLVHGYRPGALSGLGFGPDRLRQVAPDLIDISLCAYGWTGPWSGRRGFDSLVQMSCGIAATGMRLKQAAHPVPLPVQALDHATGYLMAAAVLRALRRRNSSGEIFSARLSLARTAVLLMSQGDRDFMGEELRPDPADYPPEVEQTGWGPAQRIHFPVQLDGKAPIWRYKAGPLRVDPAAWP